MCLLIAPVFQGFFLLWPFTVLMKQTRQAVHTIRQSISLDVYELLSLAVAAIFCLKNHRPILYRSVLKTPPMETRLIHVNLATESLVGLRYKSLICKGACTHKLLILPAQQKLLILCNFFLYLPFDKYCLSTGLNH